VAPPLPVVSATHLGSLLRRRLAARFDTPLPS